ncbi:Ecm7p KNAG_0B06620 [Huiozyma naganishii CBS 8797]|uniref:Uncharacterized protein n=1 Tax=Huiozyma naganishii (strain ATCC MYA-139 / BCRC 22969 / CBS 8797 / KCTC 17520 / NBRC 10181 / NCYC 3082 / Yp74L-3) TaxID=1071383 RepID=J7RHR8_HUIN7|nr:hypothetical protein KNAG_0B06620 [Kazachstania naganishii CBS 8797]CCK69088.1 hypothetical protein KNAG_0B06620 [Kazachstania naganishii CBS 8797]
MGERAEQRRFWVRQAVRRPFENLTALERLVQVVRLVSTAVVIALVTVLCSGPAVFPQRFYMSRLDTFSSDIASGIFSALRGNIETGSSGGSTEINNGVGLTTSELLILTSYTISQVRNVPQFITVSLYGTCDAWFASSTESMPTFDTDGGFAKVTGSVVTYDCQYHGPDYLFDYREVLSNVGLDIVLDYAYNKDQTTTGTTMGTGMSTDGSKQYTSYIRRIRLLKERTIRLLYAVDGAECAILVLTVWYYYIRGRHISPVKEKVLLHGTSLLSLMVLVCGLTAVICLAWINYSVQDKIKVELEAFGFSYHLGGAWFTCLWVLAFFFGVSALMWSGLEWCIADSTTDAADCDGTANDAMILGLNPSYDDLDATSTLGATAELENPFADPVPAAARSLACNNKRIASNNRNSEDNDDGDDYDDSEAYELHSILLQSSDGEQPDDQYSVQHIVIPSSTMHF